MGRDDCKFLVGTTVNFGRDDCKFVVGMSVNLWSGCQLIFGRDDGTRCLRPLSLRLVVTRGGIAGLLCRLRNCE